MRNLSELYSFGIQDPLFIILIIALGYYRVNYMVNKYQLESHRTTLTGLFAFHMFFGLVYMLYVTFLGGDAYGYWRIGLEQIALVDATWLDYYGTNTTFILFVVYPFSQIVGLNFLSGSLMFSLFGFIGFSYIYLIMQPYGKYMTFRGVKLFPTILFLPNLHFWSSGVGKDALIFMCIAIFIYSAKSIYKNIFLAVVAFALIYHIRPHMAILLGGSYVMASFLGGNLSFGQRFVGLSVGVAGLVLVFPMALEFLQIEEFSAAAIQNKAVNQASVLSRSSVGSAVDIANYSFPLKVFTYLFRPLFIDAHNLFALIISLENLVYLFIFLLLFSTRTIKVFFLAPSHIKMGMMAFIGATIIFSMSLGNLGIAMRMKNMTMIYMLVFSCMVVGYSQYIKTGPNEIREQ